MILTDSQLKGNWGEQFIASELAAKGCLVRQVTQGHDTGVDLYCETTWNGIPFLHFWCQIKTKKMLGQKEKIYYSPPQKQKKHIDYWLKQPVPVFIFIIPSFLRDKQIKKPYYICTPLHIKNGAMPSFLKVMHPNTLHRFLDSLIFMTQQWDAKDGRLNPIKRPDTPDFFVGFEPGMTLPYKKEILSSIRWGLWRVIDDTLFLGDGQEKSHMFYDLAPLSAKRKQRIKEVKPYVEALKCLCEKNQNQTLHWESYYVIGQYHELAKAFDAALIYYEKALAVIDIIVKKYPTNRHTISSHRNDVVKAIRRVKDLSTRTKGFAT